MEHLEQFFIECRNTGLYWFCLTSFCDWSRKLVPLSQPIKCKTETNHELVVRGFPALHAVWLFLLWVHHWFSKVFLFSSDWSLITLVLVFAALNRYAPYWYWSLVGNSSSLTIGTLRLSLTVSCIDQWWLTGSVHRFRTMQFSLPQEHSVWRFVYSLG